MKLFILIGLSLFLTACGAGSLIGLQRKELGVQGDRIVLHMELGDAKNYLSNACTDKEGTPEASKNVVACEWEIAEDEEHKFINKRNLTLDQQTTFRRGDDEYAIIMKRFQTRDFSQKNTYEFTEGNDDTTVIELKKLQIFGKEQPEAFGVDAKNICKNMGLVMKDLDDDWVNCKEKSLWGKRFEFYKFNLENKSNLTITLKVEGSEKDSRNIRYWQVTTEEKEKTVELSKDRNQIRDYKKYDLNIGDGNSPPNNRSFCERNEGLCDLGSWGLVLGALTKLVDAVKS